MINEDHAAATSARGARHETAGNRQDALRAKGRVRRETAEGHQDVPRARGRVRRETAEGH